MGIDTNALTLGTSMPAKTSFAARTDDSGVQASQHPASNGAAGAGSDQAGSPAAGGNDQSDSTDSATAAGQKTTGPSAQTRSAQASRNRGSASATRARSNAATASAAPTGAAPQDAATDSGTDFGSVMASALGRSAATTSVAAIPATATGTADSATTEAPAQSAAGSPADAIAWFAQALMAPAANAPVAAAISNAAVTANSTDPIGTASGSVTAGSGPQTARALAAQFATQNALTGGQSPDSAPAAPVAHTDDAALSAALTPPTGTLNALADVQKLISGLTGANPTDIDTDADGDSATPKSHASSISGSTDAGEAAAALQGSALIRADNSVGSATLTIQAPVGSAAFADEVSAKAAGLAQSGITQAQLQLNPADMGPVQVHITMQAGQASVWFGANHADTRAALEQSLPRLRELFAGAGMPLTDSGVFREPPQQQQAQSLPASGNSRGTLGDTAVAPTVTQVSNIRLALLDTYA